MADEKKGGAQPQGQQNPQGGGYRGRGGGGGNWQVDTMNATAALIRETEDRAAARTAHQEHWESVELAKAQSGIAGVPLPVPATDEAAVRRGIAAYRPQTSADVVTMYDAVHQPASTAVMAAARVIAKVNPANAEEAVAIHEAIHHPPGALSRFFHRLIPNGITGSGTAKVLGAVAVLVIVLSLFGCGNARRDIVSAVDRAGVRGVQHDVQATVRDTVGARWRYRRDSLELVLHSATAERQDTLNYRIEMARIEAGAVRVASDPSAVEEPEDPAPEPILPNRGPCPPGDWECMGTWRPVGR